jgi:proteasome accessory factor C
MSRLTASDRVRRLLSIVPWIAAQDGPTIEEICARFDIPADRLHDDLAKVPFVGVYPFTADVLIELVIEQGRVWVRYAPVFERPLRVAPAQALALVAAGRSLLSVPGADPDGPLARGLAKLADTIGVDPAEALDIRLGDAAETTLAALRDAVDQRQSVEIDYYSYGSDRRSRRRLDPYVVQVDGGHWYVRGHCHRAGSQRVFRIDRIASLTPTGERFERPEDVSLGEVFEPAPDQPRAVLDLDPQAAWVIDQYPVDAVDVLADGRRRVTLAVSARPWLERLLVRLGPHASIVEIPAELGGAQVGAEAARRILLRYRG